MKKKIALLLAFSMMLSILPLNVFATTSLAITDSSIGVGNTGALNRADQGPANNLRNMEDGTLVGTEANTNRIIGLQNSGTKLGWTGGDDFGTVVKAPGTNLREIVLRGDYFRGRNTVDRPILATSITMEIKNVKMWLSSFNAIASETIYTNEPNVQTTRSIDPLTQVASATGFDGDMFKVAASGSTTGSAFPPTNEHPSVPSWENSDLTNTQYVEGMVQFLTGFTGDGPTVAEINAATVELAADFYANDPKDILYWYIDKDDNIFKPYPAEYEIMTGDVVYFYDPLARAGNFSQINIAVGTTINDTAISKANRAWWVRFDDSRKATADQILQLRTVFNDVLFDGSGNAANRREVMYSSAWRQNPLQPYSINNPTFGVVVVQVNDTRAEILMWRNNAFNDAFISNPQSNGLAAIPYFAVPIEYVTNGDTNDNPVYLLYSARHAWGAIGQNGSGRTDLTVVSDQRFDFTLDGDPRVFHRYGRAEIEPIRISEAVQEAFDASAWWVELDIVTPGFYWTTDSVDRYNANDRGTRLETRYGDLSVGRDIRPVSLPGTTVRSPEDGIDRYSTLSFPLDLEGVDKSTNRYDRDWLQFSGLSIGANDRARIGDVEVEVRLYRRGTIIDNNNGAIRGAWQWFGNGPIPTNHPDYDSAYPNKNYSASTPSPSFQGGNGRPTVVDDPETWNGLPAGYRGTWQWMSYETGNWGPVGDTVADGTLKVARFGEIGLELFVHEDDDVEEFQLRSGMREWDFVAEPEVGESRPIGAIIPESSLMEYHQTARAVLRETAPGSLPATGAHPTIFTFNEGIQVLGARIWANDAAYIDVHNDADEEVWFGNQKMEADNFVNATIERNSLTVRPEIGKNEERRWQLAQLTVEFYLSVQPGFESLYGEDVEVKVNSGTIDAPFEGTLTLAYAWDPIQVSTTNIVLDENDIEAAQGVVRAVPLSDITITETRNGELYPGQRIWIGLEGGIGRAWNQADSQSIRATSVEIKGDTQMAITPIQHDSHGFFVEITRGSKEDGAQIVFSGVEASGRVVPDNQYHIIVADNAASHNWEGWGWIHNQAASVGFTRGLVRGFFNEEPYLTPAFRFDGAEFYAPPTTTLPGQVTPPVGTVPPVITAPVTLGEWMGNFNSLRVPGRVIDGPPLILVPNLEDPSFQTSYVMFAVVADLLGIQGTFDEATRTGTFTNEVTTVLVTNGQTTASVNGVSREIRTARSSSRPNGLLADARIINDRFYVPITFFRDVVPEFPISLQWNDGAPGSRSVTVYPK